MHLPDHSYRPTGKIRDMDAEWLKSYARWKYRDADNAVRLIEQDPAQFRKLYGDTEWQRLQADWQEHCRRQAPSESRPVTRQLALQPSTWRLLDALVQSNSSRSLDKAIQAAAFILLGKARTESILKE